MKIILIGKIGNKLNFSTLYCVERNGHDDCRNPCKSHI